jgi:hypothetical protein
VKNWWASPVPSAEATTPAPRMSQPWTEFDHVPAIAKGRPQRSDLGATRLQATETLFSHPRVHRPGDAGDFNKTQLTCARRRDRSSYRSPIPPLAFAQQRASVSVDADVCFARRLVRELAIELATKESAGSGGVGAAAHDQIRPGGCGRRRQPGLLLCA